MNKVLVFGSLNVDHVYLVDHFVRPGETLSSESLTFYPGGKGLNQAVAFAKSGARTAMAGAVGKDGESLLLPVLEEAGVDTSLIKVLDAPSGHAVIQTTKEGENNILLYGGTNRMIDEAYADEVFQHFGEGDVVILQNEISALAALMEKAHSKGMSIVLNPSPADEKIFSLPLRYVDFLILNEVEGEVLTGIGVNEPEKIVKALSESLPEIKIVLTLGEEGALYGDGDVVIKCKAFPAIVVDTTAAGDTFTGYFISEIMAGKSPETALRTASMAASLAISKKGAAVSIPCKEEVEKALDEIIDQGGSS